MTQHAPSRSGATFHQPAPLWAPAHEVAEDRRMHRRTAVTDIPVALRMGDAHASAAPLCGRLLNLSVGGCCVAVARADVTETGAAHLAAGRICCIGLPVGATGVTSYPATVLRVVGDDGAQAHVTVRLRFGPSAPAPQQRLRRWLLQLWLRSWHPALADAPSETLSRLVGAGQAAFRLTRSPASAPSKDTAIDPFATVATS